MPGFIPHTSRARARLPAQVSFMAYWLQRLAAAIVGGDARRAFSALDKRAGLLT